MDQHEDTMTVGQLREALECYPDNMPLFFGCPDEANPLQLLEVENRGDFLHVHFQLNVYKGGIEKGRAQSKEKGRFQ